MPTQPPRAVLLCFDGVVDDSDLPVQAFARHITEQLPAEHIRPIIAGMRGFLEGKTELIPPDIDLSPAEDGYQAVEILARAAGLDDDAISGARQASRADLAASAWAVEPPAGLHTLLAALDGSARVLLLTEPGDPAVRPVLASIEVTVDDIVDASAVLAVSRIVEQLGDDPDRLLAIGSRWAGQVQPAHDQGCHTALVDRFGGGRGTPTYRSPSLVGLAHPIARWLRSGSTQ